jgi:hypothetical protein
MPDDSQLRDAVAKLIRQLEMNEWVNREGHAIKNHIAILPVKMPAKAHLILGSQQPIRSYLRQHKRCSRVAKTPTERYQWTTERPSKLLYIIAPARDEQE